MSPFCPWALAGASSSCALITAVGTWLQVTMKTLQDSCTRVINKYHCLKSHCNTQTPETYLCIQKHAQKSIAKQEFPLCCNLSPPQVIQGYYRWPRLQRRPLPTLPGFFPYTRKRMRQPVCGALQMPLSSCYFHSNPRGFSVSASAN